MTPLNADAGRLKNHSDPDEFENETQLYTLAMLADLVKLPISTMRRWLRRGIIQPVRQIKKVTYFDFPEIAHARRIAKLIAESKVPKQIESKLARVAARHPCLNRPLQHFSLVADGNGVLVQHDQCLIEPDGQMRLSFDEDVESIDSACYPLNLGNASSFFTLESTPADSAAIQRACQTLSSPRKFMEFASELESRQELDAAIEVHRACLLAFGPSAQLAVRLAELLYLVGDLPAARERYYMAIELDESLVEARSNLGCVLVELNQYDLALAAFQGALKYHEEFPDVHFYLARLLDEMERNIEAEFHWKYFLTLAPKSPWADEARHRLDCGFKVDL
jgi:tetratricopeptide (TPR) repeat protein